MSVFITGFVLPEASPAVPGLPSAREFLTSPGFVGAVALLAVLVAAAIAVIGLRAAAARNRVQLAQRERHYQEAREDERREAAVSECWRRFRWVVDAGRIEPAASEGVTLGPGPKLALALLRGLLRDAEELGDDTLATAVAAHLDQFTLVLAQQSGRLAELPVVYSAADTDTDQQAALDGSRLSR